MPAIDLLFPGQKRKALTLSYDDGVEQDIRLIDIMRKHGLKGTFNLNSGLYAQEGTVYPAGQVHRRLSERAVTALYADSGMEVAVHALEHPRLESLPREAVAYQIVKDRENLEKQFGHIVRGMAYPYGTTSEAVVDVLRNCGIAYSRTVVSTGKFDLPTDWLRLPATCHHKDPELMNLARKFAEGKPNGAPWLFYLWGHSYEFEERDNWNVIEEFAAYLGGRDDVWYATNIEIYEYIEAFRSLVSSVDGKTYHNPSAITVEFLSRGKSYAVAPGGSVVIG